MTRKKAAVLFTGGKDSCLALLKTSKKCDIKFLLTIIPSSYDSYMFHKPSMHLLLKQSESLNIPLIFKESKTKKEKELEDLEKLLKKVKGKVDLIISGGVASKYQLDRIKKLCVNLNFVLENPLWNMKSEEIWRECLKNKFKIILTKICCGGLDKEFLGKPIDKKIFEILKQKANKHGFSLEFEGGDAETTVLYMPLFKKEIKIETEIKSEGEYRHFLIIKNAKL